MTDPTGPGPTTRRGEPPEWLVAQAGQLEAAQAADGGQSTRDVVSWLAESVLDGTYEAPQGLDQG